MMNNNYLDDKNFETVSQEIYKKCYKDESESEDKEMKEYTSNKPRRIIISARLADL